MKISLEIKAKDNMCYDCIHKFKRRVFNSSPWVCNLFRTENDLGHTGTCLNTKEGKPIRCRACQDATIN